MTRRTFVRICAWLVTAAVVIVGGLYVAHAAGSRPHLATSVRASYSITTAAGDACIGGTFTHAAP